MSTHLDDGLPIAITVDGSGLAFAVEWGEDGTAVEVSIEFPDYSGWSGPTTGERSITISRDDWAAIVAHVALPRFEHR